MTRYGGHTTFSAELLLHLHCAVSLISQWRHLAITGFHLQSVWHRCDDLARYPWCMPLRRLVMVVALRRREIRRPKHLGAIGVFPSMLLLRFPKMGRLGLLCSRNSISIRVCAYLAVARRFMRLVLHWVVAPLICNLEYGGLSLCDTGAARDGEKGTRRPQTLPRNSSCPVLPAVLLSSFMESRSRAMGDVPCNGRINWPYAFNSSGLSHVGCGPAALLSPRLWSGAGRDLMLPVLCS